ncbi:unnamed protein product [Calypogeia fissa]
MHAATRETATESDFLATLRSTSVTSPRLASPLRSIDRSTKHSIAGRSRVHARGRKTRKQRASKATKQPGERARGLDGTTAEGDDGRGPARGQGWTGKLAQTDRETDGPRRPVTEGTRHSRTTRPRLPPDPARPPLRVRFLPVLLRTNVTEYVQYIVYSSSIEYGTVLLRTAYGVKVWYVVLCYC